MIVQERHQVIMNVLTRKPRLEFDRLQGELGVSRSTLRRDLIELEHMGEVVRQRGIVLHADFIRGEPTFDRRRATQIQEKRAIAVRAAELVQDNACVYLDAGTTCLEVGRLLMKRADLRVFTHSIRLVTEAAESQASIICVGGEYRRVSDALVGGLTIAWLNHLRFDIAFVAASGMDADGLSTTELSESAVKSQLIVRSKRQVVVADSSKWNNPAAVKFADWSNVSDLVTDAAIAASTRKVIRSKAVSVHLAN